MLRRPDLCKTYMKTHSHRLLLNLCIVLNLLSLMLLTTAHPVPRTYSRFTASIRTESLELQAGNWGVTEVDAVVRVVFPDPAEGQQFNIKSAVTVWIEVSAIDGHSMQDVDPQTITLEYEGDSITPDECAVEQDKLELRFKKVASILEGKLPAGKSLISLTLKGQLQNGIKFSGTCNLWVHVPPGAVDEEEQELTTSRQEDAQEAAMPQTAPEDECIDDIKDGCEGDCQDNCLDAGQDDVVVTQSTEDGRGE